MPNKKFIDFDLKTSISEVDYIVGYKEDGTAEYRTTFKDFVDYLRPFFQELPSELLGPNAILNWDLQRSSYSGTGTTLTDLKGKSNGNIVGSGFTYVTGSPNYLQFTGSASNYIISNTNLNPFLSPPNTSRVISVFMWIYPTGNGIILSEHGANTPTSGWYNSQIGWKNGTPVFATWPYVGGGPVIIPTSGQAAFNRWYLIGFTHTGTMLKVYINGAFGGQSAHTRQGPYSQSAGLHYTLGYPTATNMGEGNPTQTRFGALYVFNTALSETEVQNLFTQTKSPYGL